MNILSIYSFFSIIFFKGGIIDFDITLPLWGFWLLPISWIVIIPITTMFCLTVLTMSMRYLKIVNIFEILKKIIMKTVLFGFLCDLIVAGFLILIMLQVYNIINYKSVFYPWLKALEENPFNNVYALLTILVTILLSRVINYKLNKRYTFSKLDIEEENKKKLALAIAIFTAPYMFFFTINI